MKAITALLTSAAMAMASPAVAKLDLDRASVSHLPNGLTVIMLDDHSFPVVSVQMLYKSGSAAEVTGKTGLAHFLEHLAFRASENFPYAAATELIYDAGGEWHGYTAMDQTTYFATMPKDGLERLLKIEADRMARTTIDPAAIAIEKGAVVTELHSYENDPAGVLQDAVVRTALQSHPYGSPMAGYVSDVERLTIDDARTYYASHYAPGNAVLAIAGDFDPASASALVAKALADVPARSVTVPHYTAEAPQHGERHFRLLGAVDKQYFQLAFPAPAATSLDFPAFLLLQQILAGSPGLNPRQSGWSGSPAVEGSRLSGTTADIATWLPATHDPFLFTISGSIDTKATQAELERALAGKIALLRDRLVPDAEMAAAKNSLLRVLDEDVLTTEDAAHQLAFFEGIGALDALLTLPKAVERVSPTDLQRVARAYLTPDKLTVGWMVPGHSQPAALGVGSPKSANDRVGSSAQSVPVQAPQLRRLSGGLPAIVQISPLSDTVVVEMLLSRPASQGDAPADLAGLGTVARSGSPKDLAKLIDEVAAGAKSGPASPEVKSEDPETRLQQLMANGMLPHASSPPEPIAVIVSGNVEPEAVVTSLEKSLGGVAGGQLIGRQDSKQWAPKRIIEHIAKPLAQGGLGYVVEGPPPGTRGALAWRMLLYVLTHDYSGRLGNSAIRDKGLVYHIYSSFRSNGRQSWATISTGVDPDKADAMETELRAQLARLASQPPTAAETDSARGHLLGRDISAAQSNDEIVAKLAREFVETGGLRSHEQLRTQLEAVTPSDLAQAAGQFTKGTIIRVDVGLKPSSK
ncbi:insulinase family protein [Sphingomonas daechungensis]